ncbi:MAG: hypothetical protein IKW10_03115 [Oscillospiraceae bacterium]|nr:hypothetical protein [Oscillospiraceae bacterium]
MCALARNDTLLVDSHFRRKYIAGAAYIAIADYIARRSLYRNRRLYRKAQPYIAFCEANTFTVHRQLSAVNFFVIARTQCGRGDLRGEMVVVHGRFPRQCAHWLGMTPCWLIHIFEENILQAQPYMAFCFAKHNRKKQGAGFHQRPLDYKKEKMRLFVEF